MIASLRQALRQAQEVLRKLSGSILSSRNAVEAYRRVRFQRRILADPHPSIRLSLRYSLLRLRPELDEGMLS